MKKFLWILAFWLPLVYLRAALLIFASEAGYKLLINEMVFEETLDVLKKNFRN